MKTITKTAYQINEHPEPEKVYNWIRDNWHDLNEHSVNEAVESLKALERTIYCKIDYSFGQFPDRGEFIKITGYDENEINELKADELPLTGVCWDHDLIEGLQKGDSEALLDAIHKDSEYVYSDEGLKELCEANDYYFYDNGEFCAE